jgi:hypothetical protein
MIKMPLSYVATQSTQRRETRRLAPFIFLPRYMSSLLPRRDLLLPRPLLLLFKPHPPQTNVISTEADHSLIVSSAVERSLYFAFPSPYF